MKLRQTGVAIVLAMGVIAFAALAATAMMVLQSTWSRQVELTDDHVQAQLIIQAGLDWARALLSDDYRVSNVDYPGEPWALRLPPVPVDNGSLAGHIMDEQGKLNLNNLVQDGKSNLSQLARFQRLLSILELPPALADGLADWIDNDSVPQPQYGAEDTYYLSRQPPYLTANRPLTDVAELAQVRGFDDKIRARLRPFVTALPQFTAVNVNTALPEVMAACIEGLQLDDARAIVAQRERTYFQSNADFINLLPPGRIVSRNTISVSSNYFLATMNVSIGEARAFGSALLERDGSGWPSIIWRKYP